MSLSDEPEEVMDLVDEQDKVIGIITREEVARQMMNLSGLVRSSNVFIINDNGEVWVPRRGSHKKIAPNGLDYSAGEHVKSGETYREAMVRGMREELNLKVPDDDLVFVKKISNASVGVPYFNAIFIYNSNVVPNYNKDDFISYEWLTPKTFMERIKSGEIGKIDLPLALEVLIKFMKNER